MTDAWVAALKGDPRPWLLDPARPAVRQLALRWLEDRPGDDPEVRTARERAYRGRLWADVDQPRQASPWVTLRACRVLRAALG